MKIGIDIDGVLTNIEQFTLDFLSKYCFENNIEYSVESSDYEAFKSFNISKEQEDMFWSNYLMYYSENEKARPFASEVIKRLKEDGHEIYIITARWLSNRNDDLGNTMRTTVREWLKENEIIYDKLIFAKSSSEKKHNEIKENNIDLMIEDNPNNVNDLSKIVPVICYHAGYNEHCTGDNIFRCYSWYDIYNKIKNTVI